MNVCKDAYKGIGGGKDPGALGQAAYVVWSEIWGQVGPRAESAIKRNEGTYDEGLLLLMERNGYPEETYYTFSYTPVPNDQGGTGGGLSAHRDDPPRVIRARHLPDRPPLTPAHPTSSPPREPPAAHPPP